MEDTHYKNLFNYINSKILPTEEKDKQQILRQSKNYVVKNNFLYKLDKNNKNNFIRVVKINELDSILYMFHDDPLGGHFATDSMFNRIRTRYYWPQMYEDIKKYVKSCDSCQRRGRSKRNNLLHPIPVHSPFYQIGIDIVGPLPRTQRGKKYIVVAIDYLTKWPEAQAITEATAEIVAHFIYEYIICRHGCPQIILSDRETHFNNHMIEKLLEKFNINHLLSMPYHPQTNGLVERFNRTLCESLAKISEKSNDWDLFIAPTLFAYRTTKHSTTGIESFFLVYGRSARLPIEETENSNVTSLNDRLKQLIDNVPQIREKSRLQIQISQQKKKIEHDKKIKKEISFTIGDKVLYFKAAQDQTHFGKLNPKWKGPYYIQDILPNGAYKLRNLEGGILAVPVNGNLLKQYFE